MLKKINLYWSMMNYGLAHNRDFAHEHFAFFSEMLERIGDPGRHRIIDIGCGKSFWLTLLLHSAGASVTGVDTELVSAKTGMRKYYAILKGNGPERALRTLCWDLLFARPYYAELAGLCSFPLRWKDLDVRCVSAITLDEFPDNSFDLAVSHEVFEHIGDLSGTLRAVHRVLRPGARTYIYVHNYTSLSGGHHIAWKYPDTEPSATVPPWDHLRENRYPDIPSSINRLREADYKKEFDKYFEISDWIPRGREGAQLLTPEIRRELAEYSEDELLTKGFIVIARPRKDS